MTGHEWVIFLFGLFWGWGYGKVFHACKRPRIDYEEEKKR